MADTPENSEAPPAAAAPAPVRKKHNKLLIILLSILLIPVVIIALWIWVSLGYTYSTGERAGYIQKISKKGWICKTWEGEIAMTPLPGATPQIFAFTVRNDSIAHVLEEYADVKRTGPPVCQQPLRTSPRSGDELRPRPAFVFEQQCKAVVGCMSPDQLGDGRHGIQYLTPRQNCATLPGWICATPSLSRCFARNCGLG